MRTILSGLLIFVCAHVATSSLKCGFRSSELDDSSRTIPQLIASRGFDYESHEVQTQDGYLLTAFRIVHPNLNQTIRPIILQHGLFGSGSTFLFNAANGSVDEGNEIVGNNLGFELAKRGYDVWLTNARGNAYTAHVSLKRSDPTFWDFSYADTGRYDVPANIDYVLNKTGHKDLAYVGYSEGTMTMWVALTHYPRLNRIVKPFIALAPMASFEGVSFASGLVNRFAALAPKLTGVRNGPVMQAMLEKDFGVFGRKYACQLVRRLEKWLQASSSVNMTRLGVYGRQLMSGTSVKNLIHFAQNMGSRRFADFDHGVVKNLRVYGRVTAPEFPLEKITNPHILLVSGLGDTIAPSIDIDILRSRVPVNMRSIVVSDPKWGHLDFAIGLEAGRYVNQPIIDILKNFP